MREHGVKNSSRWQSPDKQRLRTSKLIDQARFGLNDAKHKTDAVQCYYTRMGKLFCLQLF